MITIMHMMRTHNGKIKENNLTIQKSKTRKEYKVWNTNIE